MSRALVESFFPALVEILQEYNPTLYESLFPTDVAELCPVVEVVGRQLQHPMLGLWALWGLCVGLVGYRNTSQYSYLWFAVMNAAAIPLHCLGIHTRLFWFLDAYATGASALEIGLRQWNGRSHYAPVCIGVFIAGLLSVFLLQSTLLLELWYLLPVAWAGGALFWKDAQRYRSVLSVGMLLALAVVWDPYLCRSGVVYYDFFYSGTLIFGLCDLAFVCLYLTETTSKYKQV